MSDKSGFNDNLNNFEKSNNERESNFEISSNIQDNPSTSDNHRDLMSQSELSKNDKKVYVHNDKKSPKKSKLFKSVWWFIVVSLSIMLSAYTIFGFADLLALGRSDQVVEVTIPKESGKSGIANALYEKGAINNPSFFKLYLLITKSESKIKQGTFEMKTNMDYAAIVNYLKSDSNRLDSDIVKVMIPEGKNVREIAEILEKNEVCSKNEFINICKSNELDRDYDFLKEVSSNDVIYKMEGYLFPDTYNFYKNTDAKTVVNKFLSNFERKMNKKEVTSESDERISMIERANKAGISMKDLINLASLIQAEAADEDDMYMISSVMHNRLKTINNGGMSPFGEGGLNLLGIDSTVWYPFRTKESVPEDLISKYPTSYDTYLNKGLPPGPICNPGAVAIDAALSPKDTQYYYFCHSKDDKKSYYAKNLAEHDKNLKKAGLL